MWKGSWSKESCGGGRRRNQQEAIEVGDPKGGDEGEELEGGGGREEGMKRGVDSKGNLTTPL